MREIIFFFFILFIPVRVFERQDAWSCGNRMLHAGNRVPRVRDPQPPTMIWRAMPRSNGPMPVGGENPIRPGITDVSGQPRARALLPFASTEFSDRADVPVPLPLCGRGFWTQPGVASGWNEHSHGASFTLHLSCLVDARRIVGTIGRHGCHRILELFDQGGDPSTVRRSTTGQIRGDHLTRTGINSEVQLPPSAVLRRFPHTADVNPEPRTADEQMDRSIRGEPAELDLAELPKPPQQGPVIRDREIQLEQVSQRTQEALGLAKRKVEDHADRQSRLDRDVRIGTQPNSAPDVETSRTCTGCASDTSSLLTSGRGPSVLIR